MNSEKLLRETSQSQKDNIFLPIGVPKVVRFTRQSGMELPKAEGRGHGGMIVYWEQSFSFGG